MSAIDRMVADSIILTNPNGPLDGAPTKPVKIQRAPVDW
jgi:peptidyl-prolyl cis-trans isomerase B (cyclophilin B)